MIKGFFAMLLCGISAINLFPSSDYTDIVPDNAESVTKASWELTGQAMRETFGKVE